MNQGTRTITVNDVSGGRVSSFALLEDGVASTGLACSQTPSSGAFFIDGNVLNWDPGFQPTGSPAQGRFVCTTDGGSVEVVFNSKPASIHVASSGWGDTAVGAQTTVTNPVLSADGSVIVWSARGGTSSGHRQILALDTATGARSVVSTTAAGQLSNNSNESPHLSADGRYVLFLTSATNLVAGAGSPTLYSNQAFVKDRQTGSLVLASSPDGTGANQSNQPIWTPRISGNGRYIVFMSIATNLVGGATGQQIFRKDLQSGAIELVSTRDGTVANRSNSACSDPQISADGRYVVFKSTGTNLVLTTTAGRNHIYRKDMTSGTIALVSSTDGTAANQGNQNSQDPHLSDDGRYVVFSSSATNLFAGSSGQQILRKDMDTGTFVLVSSTDGTAGNRGNGSSTTVPRVSADGNRVVFRSNSTNFVAGAPASAQIYRRDISANTVVLASSVDGTGSQAGNQGSFMPEISGDGRYVAFYTNSSNLAGAGADVGWFNKAFRKDLSTGTLLLVNANGASAPSIADATASNPRWSPNGRFVVFESSAKNLYSGLTGAFSQIYRKDLQSGALSLASSTDGTAAGSAGASVYTPDVSLDGRYVVFATGATNLVTGSTSQQIFRKDLQSGAIALVSSVDGSAGTRGNSSSSNPRISADGRYVAFTTWATNLVVGATGFASQVLVKDMNTQSIYLASSVDGTSATEDDGGADYPLISQDGTYVAFQSYSTNLMAGVNGEGQIFRKNIFTQALQLASSSDGTAPNRSDYSEMPEMSRDGRYIVFLTWATTWMAGLNGSGQIWRKDMATGTLSLVSSLDGTGATEGNNESERPSVSDDGRYVTFSSVAGNLFAGTQNWYDIYRKDMMTGAIDLVSSRDGAVTTNFDEADETWSQISADGRFVLFLSGDSSLVDGVFWGSNQVFVRDMQLP